MKFGTIASGSSGNCIYVKSGNRNILIDAGISLKRIEAGLAGYGLKVSDLDAILVTHEHSDHISGLGTLLRKYEVPVYLTDGTLSAINKGGLIGRVPEEFFNVIRPEHAFALGDINVEAFGISHDAAEPVCYRIECREGAQAATGDVLQTAARSLAIATDLGTYDDRLIERLLGLDAVLLEANHDVRMLQAGPYPYQLKARILSDRGHLSNESAAEFLKRIYSDRLHSVVLGHLSKTNNYEELARECVRLEMQFAGLESDLSVASRTAPSELIEV